MQLNYYSVYREFRKLYPRFGKDDAQTMLNMLEQLKIVPKIDLDGGKVNRIFFATPGMKKNYEFYGDIVLVDSTYRVNQYNIPLIVYSGVDSGGRNIIFGLALVNDESGETHEWCLEQFFDTHKKLPSLFVTDQDLSLLSVLDHKYPQITHFLCQWHIVQNFKRHFAFLQNMHLKTTYDQILILPYIIDVEEFENLRNYHKHFNIEEI